MKRLFIMLSAAFLTIFSLSSASFAQDGDPVKGAKVFKKCKACHTVDEGGRNLIGPNLFGIVGRKSGENEDYRYSSAMTKADMVWDDENLDSYLKKPRDVVPGTKMTFAGLKKAEQRADVIAYLKTLK